MAAAVTSLSLVPESLLWGRAQVPGRGARSAPKPSQGPAAASPLSLASLVFPRLPLPCLGLARRRRSGGQLAVSQTLAGHFTRKPLKSVAITGLTSVEAECLLVKVTEQVERLNTDVGSLERSLEQAPEILDAVGVHLTLNVLLGMVDDATNVLALKAIVASPSVANNLYEIAEAIPPAYTEYIGRQLMTHIKAVSS